ncbi:MAG TPA: TlpA disulfide reductase family protein [Gammaproteobacteria bacterium]|nr:TlpA disulfide reductase family protein [Gammaproteobacteria bacterium]
MKRLLRATALVLCVCLPISSLAAAARQAPDFRLPGVKSEVKLSAYRGKVVYIDFWASWCGPCRKSFPWMNELQEKYGSRVKIIAINLDQERAEADKFLEQNSPKFTVVFDPAGKTAESYRVKAMPSSYLIDSNGRIVSSHAGFRSRDKEELEKMIEQIIKK